MISPRRRGRRDNGLDARTFRALRDVDPRVGEHLLDVLRDAGIAAYLDPTSDVDAVTRSIALPSPPSDRLFVDREHSAAATTLLDDYDMDDDMDDDDPDDGDPGDHAAGAIAEPSLDPPAAGSSWNMAPGGPGSTTPSTPSSVDDVQWRELIAAYEHDHGRLGDTLTEDFDDTARLRAAERDAAAQAALDAEEAADEEHYEPPPPPPLPVLSRAAAYALLLLAGGALLLIAPGVIGLSGQLGFVFGVLGIASGVGMLVWRMREGPRYEDPDDGAVV